MLPPRDFKLLVRKYFNAKDVAFSPGDATQAAEAVLTEAETEKQIRRELKTFTAQELAELPFQDTPKYGGLKFSTPEQLNPNL